MGGCNRLVDIQDGVDCGTSAFLNLSPRPDSPLTAPFQPSQNGGKGAGHFRISAQFQLHRCSQICSDRRAISVQVFKIFRVDRRWRGGVLAFNAAGMDFELREHDISQALRTALRRNRRSHSPRVRDRARIPWRQRCRRQGAPTERSAGLSPAPLRQAGPLSEVRLRSAQKTSANREDRDDTARPAMVPYSSRNARAIWSVKGFMK